MIKHIAEILYQKYKVCGIDINIVLKSINQWLSEYVLVYILMVIIMVSTGDPNSTNDYQTLTSLHWEICLLPTRLRTSSVREGASTHGTKQ